MKSTPAGNFFCPECWPKIDDKNEPIRKCPVDGSDMQKRSLQNWCSSTYAKRAVARGLTMRNLKSFELGRRMMVGAMGSLLVGSSVRFAAQPIVGRERRERVSHDDGSGDA